MRSIVLRGELERSNMTSEEVARLGEIVAAVAWRLTEVEKRWNGSIVVGFKSGIQAYRASGRVLK